MILQRIKKLASKSLTVLCGFAVIAVSLIVVDMVYTAYGPRPAAAAESGSAIETIKGNLRIQLSSRAVGLSSATVAIIEFGDFQCPFCARHSQEVFPRIEGDYITPGVVKYDFRHFPLEAHQFALPAAQAAECALAQKSFWPMRQFLYSSQKSLDRDSLIAGGRVLGLDVPRFGECISGKSEKAIGLDVAEASKLGVRSTPTFFLGRIQPGGDVLIWKKVTGAQPFLTFETVLAELVGSKQAVRN
jgi:protein-disulfide isomerase